MTTTAVPSATLRRLHRPLLACSAAMGALVLFSLGAMVVDQRQLLGESVWLKPFKFGLAFLLYAGTLAWLLSLPHKGSRITWWLGTVFAVTGFVDVGFVVVQAARGTFSHFNADSTDRVNEIGQMVFASGVPGLFFANLLIVLILSWQRLLDRPTSRAIHAGLALAVAGMALGYLMGFTGEQTVRDTDGRSLPLSAGHTVMQSTPPVRDGVDTMPITHWSTAGGDLRVPHFAGLHGIQVLLAAAVALAWLAHRHPWLTERVRARLIGVLAVGYAGMLALLLRQALRAQPLLRPDGTTALTAAALAAITLAAAALIVQRARRATELPGPTVFRVPTPPLGDTAPTR
ncbi:hypothetical protein [Nocardia mexicana]|uniref:Uncharacterized protein n=1 Tax=Nocardia mexicana TaxID=279262 RepID=A0A370H4V5_9NOCA|nr:hypothetical protein [Nocardia mexicana]RDI50974.1 hypothetical protein DFR68_105451 [Nocardia mexicana]